MDAEALDIIGDTLGTLADITEYGMAHRDDDGAEQPEKPVVLGEMTPLRLGVVAASLTAVGACIWWAATINAKLDMLVSQRSQDSANISILAKDIAELKEWRIRIDSKGSPMLDELRKEMEDMRTQFQLHKATTMTPKP